MFDYPSGRIYRMSYISIGVVVGLLTVFVFKWYLHFKSYRFVKISLIKILGNGLLLVSDVVFLFLLGFALNLTISVLTGSLFDTSHGNGGLGAVFWMGYMLIRVNIALGLFNLVLMSILNRNKTWSYSDKSFVFIYLLPILIFFLFIL